MANPGQFTLSDILADVGAIVAQDTSIPSGTDLTTQVNLINQSLREWANHYQWSQLRVFQYAPSIQLSTTSMALPLNFKKLMSRPFRMDLSTGNDYEEVRPEEYYSKMSSDPNGRFCVTGGDSSVGKFLLINPALPSGASLLMDYESFPSAMATLTDVCVCPSRGFMIKRTLSKIFEARADSRFPTFKQEADDSLEQMMEIEASLSGGMTNQTRNQYKFFGFTIGHDG